MTDHAMPTEEDEDRFYAALGRAITRWAELEEILFEITFAILGCTRERTAIVFYRTPTLDSRLTLTSDLVHSYFPRHRPGEQPDPRVTRWKEIQAAIRMNTPVRNRLAHHPVGPIMDVYLSADGDEHKIVVKAGSYISEGERLRKREELVPLGLTEIEEHTKTVLKLINELRNFRRQEFPKPPLAPVE